MKKYLHLYNPNKPTYGIFLKLKCSSKEILFFMHYNTAFRYIFQILDKMIFIARTPRPFFCCFFVKNYNLNVSLHGRGAPSITMAGRGECETGNNH